MTDPDAHYRPLGYDGPLYYVMSAAKQQMGAYTAQQLMSAAGLLDIVSDHDYWAEYYGERRRIDWQRAGADIMRRCLEAGLFDPRMVRGRGVWLDAGRTVVHMGATVTGDISDSAYIYQARPPLAMGDSTDDGPVGAILEACARIPWVEPIHAEFLAGWIALAPVCGALPHRVHIRVDGDVADLVRACLGPLLIDGDVAVAQDARPLMTDGYVRNPGACMLLSTGRQPDALVLTVGDGDALPASVPPETPRRLLARQVAGLDALRHNIATFRALSRARPEIGTLMAGAWSLYSAEVMSVELARGFLGRYAP